MIDSHCHLGIDDFKDNTKEYLENAKKNGVSHLLTVACDYAQVGDLKQMMAFADVFCAFGIHPENAKNFNYEASRKIYEQNKNIVAVGEIGLDFYYNPETKEEQINAFQEQIKLAHQIHKPIIIHTRDAEDETAFILKRSYEDGLLGEGGVLHCFTGSYDLAKVALDFGFYISASGIITFKKSHDLREVFKNIPLDKLLVETDAPYLAPMPNRGKTNEPAFVKYTIEKLAEIKNVSFEEMEHITTQNFFNLFKEAKNES